MDLSLHCAHCGGEYVGRTNSLYCSKRCRKRVEKLRLRRRELEDRLDHSQRMLRLASLKGDTRLARIHEVRIDRLNGALATGSESSPQNLHLVSPYQRVHAAAHEAETAPCD
jgi:hypothetical protein